MTSPDGTLPIATERLTVRSTAVSGVGVVLSIGAGLFLAGWWIHHVRSERRLKSAQDPTPASLDTGAGHLTAVTDRRLATVRAITTVADDRELVSAAQAGDRAAMDALLRRHYDRIFALCRRVTGSDADGADAAQEALIAIVRGLPRFDGRARVLDVGVPRRDERVPRRAATPAPPSACPASVTADEGGRGRPDRRRPAARRSGRRSPRHRCRARDSCRPTSVPLSCCATCASSTTPRSARCSASRPERFGRGSPAGGRRSRRCARREPRSPDPTSYRVAMSDQPMSGDELASALLDGEVPRPQHGRRRLSPPGRGAPPRSPTRSPRPVPIDDVVHERAIAAALAEFDALRVERHRPVATTIATTAAAAPPVHSLALLRCCGRGRSC